MLWSRAPRESQTRGLSLAGQFLLLQLVVVAAVLGVVAVVSVSQTTRAFEQDRGAQMRSVAEYVANQTTVRTRIGSAGAARALAPMVDRALSLSGASVVSIASPDGRVIASSDPSLVGTRAALGASRVREGRGWTGNVRTEGRTDVAGHAPILADDGRLVGLALAEQRYPSVWQRLVNAGPDLLLFLGVGALLGAGGSWLLSRLFKRRTRGLGAREFATLADHREALLHSIREGVVAVDPDGRVTVANDGARAMLRLGPDVVGRHVDELGLEPALAAALRSREEGEDEIFVVDDQVLVLNQRRAASRGRGIGTVTTMRDRTELTALRSRLSSTVSITDTLRAQTHEFANQLHTISGLVELEEYGEVRTLVGTLTDRREAQVEFVSARIADRAVAALVIAKSSVAAEAGVELRLAEDSELPALPPDLSADLTTITGNLVDNGIDAVRGRVDGQVTVRVRTDDGCLRLVVADNGPGVPTELRDSIFVRGVSTKPSVPGGRGIGLPLVGLLCQQRAGAVSVSDGPDGGAVFLVELPQET